MPMGLVSFMSSFKEEGRIIKSGENHYQTTGPVESGK